MDYAGRVALVTGGANGIGRATARAFAAGGASVVIVDRDAESGLATAEEIGSGARFVAADVTRSDEVRRYVALTLDALGRIDCFFNNAGVEGRKATLMDCDEAEFDRVIAVNLRGMFLRLKYVLPVMVRQGRGAVVNTSSIAGVLGAAGFGAYSASKHGVIGLTRTASGEVARSGVRVNAICPSAVDTRMIHAIEAQIDPADPDRVSRLNADSMPTGRYSTPEEIAGLVLYLCSDLAANITGEHILVDGGRMASNGFLR